MWVDALLTTCALILSVSAVSMLIGVATAITAWWSNNQWAYYFPLLSLSVPPWLLSYHMSEYGYMNPWIGATLSLGICSSIYPHCIVLSSLNDRAHKAWEMMVVANGKNLKSLAFAIWPSIRLSLLPSVAVVAAECIADFGVSDFYGLNTVTMFTFNVWSSTWDGAKIWYGVALLFIMGLVVGKLSTPSSFAIYGDKTDIRPNKLVGLLPLIPTIVILVLGVYQSIHWIQLGGKFHSAEILNELLNTVRLVVMVSVICVLVTISYVLCSSNTWVERIGLALYSMPGVVIGAGLLYACGNYLSMMTLLVIAIIVRYYGLAINTLAVSVNSNAKIFEVIDLYSLSKSSQVHLKLQTMLPNLILGICLIALDVMRELPMSIILQPAEFQTLAMRMNYIARTEAIPDLGHHSLMVMTLGAIFCSIIMGIIYATNKKSKNYQLSTK